MTAFVFEQLKEKLPPIIARQKVSEYFGGAISPKTLANEDSKGEGPEGAFKVGRTVVYPTLSLLEWLQQRSKSVSTGYGKEVVYESKF